MEYREFTAKTVDEAITDAQVALGVTSDQLEYEVVEEGSSGFLGIGNKDAVIRARKKEEVTDSIAVTSDTSSTASDKSLEKPAESAKPAYEWSESNGKDAEKFLKDIMNCMDVQADVKVSKSAEDGAMDIELVGNSMGILIGKRGQTLDALQYLTSLVVNKNTEGYTRVRLDTEDYRARRQHTLENLAKNIAFKVKREKKPVTLEPMNPFERRIIHTALQNDNYVTTYSEGDDPYRHVVVALKK